MLLVLARVQPAVDRRRVERTSDSRIGPDGSWTAEISAKGTSLPHVSFLPGADAPRPLKAESRAKPRHQKRHFVVDRLDRAAVIRWPRGQSKDMRS